MGKPIEIEVGAGGYNPTAGTSVWNYPTIAGQEFYVEKVGYGTLDSDLYTALTTGGFQLASETFQPSEKFRVHLTGLSYGTASGSYTNGFDFTRVISAMFGRVGWKQPLKTGSPVINSTNLMSKGGRYFNDGSFHAIVTVDNVKATMEEASATDNNLNAHLEAVQRAAIMRCLNSVFREPEYHQQVLVFDRYDSNDQPVNNTDQFVGYEINLAPAMNKGIQIDSATLLFDQDVTFNLYLFKDGKKSPLAVIEVSAVAYETTVVNFSDLVLKYIGSATKGSCYYFGYFQSDLGSVKAIREEGCLNYKTVCFNARPMITRQNTGEYDFDRLTRSYTNEPYGINLEMSVFEDHTQMIVKKAGLFDEAIGLTASYMIIEQIIYTCRSNANERVLKDELAKVGIQMDLNGAAPVSDSPKIKGLNIRIEEELKRLRNSFYPRAKSLTVNIAECW